MKRTLSFLVLLSLLLTGCSKGNSSENKQTIDPDEGKVVLHTRIQRTYLRGPIHDIDLYARGAEELSRPETYTFSWDEINAPYTVFVSDQADFSDAFSYTCDTNSLTLTNLKVGTTYRYKVFSNDAIIEDETFTTSSEIIRNLHISGVTNARDLGGYEIDGKMSKQGVLFRTGRLNENSVDEVDITISSRGINTMLNDLKVKTEIDLRGVSDNEVGGLTEGTSVLGEGVKYYQCPMEYSTTMDKGDNDQSLRKVFSILGNKDNYPLFFHCSIGTDRTGYIAWLINASLGLKEDCLWRDYLFSNFGRINSARDRSYIEDGYLKNIKEKEGDSLKEKTINYLLSKGVKQSEIDTIKEMMLG
jgi:hypothetical protein